MIEEDDEREIREWIKEKLRELKHIENKKSEVKNVANQSLSNENTANVSRLEEKSKNQSKFKILLIINLILLIAIVSLSYIILFHESCSNLNYLYSHLDKCEGGFVSMEGVAFTNSSRFPEQGNPFYLEKDGYLIDVRGVENVKVGEKIKINGNIITKPLVFVNVTSFKKEGLVDNYDIERECEKNGIKVDNIENLKERGRLFITNLTLIDYSTSISPSDDKVFVFSLKWKEANLKSFTTSYVNKSLDINKSYKVCGIILPTTMGDILRIFLMS
jgi:hypothetical protein